MRFQQTCGPVMAKGVEDTAFYRYGRLLALNEVGGDPVALRRAGRPSSTPARRAPQARWPLTMTTLSTHDTKRSEDVRARLVAARRRTPALGSASATRLLTLAQQVHGPAGPEPRHAVPRAADADRRLSRSTRSGSAPTWRRRPARPSSTRPGPPRTRPTTQASQAYVRGVLADRAIMAAAEEYAAELIEPGRVNALAQKLRAADHARQSRTSTRAASCGTCRWSTRTTGGRSTSASAPGSSSTLDRATRRTPRVDDSGAAKLHLVRSGAAAAARAARSSSAPDADYQPLEVTGSAAEHVIAFARGRRPPDRAVTVVPRLVLGLRQAGGWKDTAVDLPARRAGPTSFTGRRHGGAGGEASERRIC